MRCCLFYKRICFKNPEGILTNPQIPLRKFNFVINQHCLLLICVDMLLSGCILGLKLKFLRLFPVLSLRVKVMVRLRAGARSLFSAVSSIYSSYGIIFLTRLHTLSEHLQHDKSTMKKSPSWRTVCYPPEQTAMYTLVKRTSYQMLPLHKNLCYFLHNGRFIIHFIWCKHCGSFNLILRPGQIILLLFSSPCFSRSGFL